jgi:hypothetical protein
MSWLHAFAYLAAAAVLGAVYLVTAPLPAPPPSPAGSAARGAGGIDAIRLEADGRTVRARRSGGQWEVIEPAGAAIPADLLSALVSAVLETPAEPVSSGTDRVAEFGLESPSARVIFERPGAPPVTLSLGDANPAQTGVYGRLEGNPQVVLLGLNVRYYIDLVLRQSGP